MLFHPRLPGHHGSLVDKIGRAWAQGSDQRDHATTGADIDIQDDGTVFLGSKEGDGAERAWKMIEEILNPRIPEVGEVFEGKVCQIDDVRSLREHTSRDGRPQSISELRKGGERVESVEDVVNVGDGARVVVVKIEQGLKPKIGLRPLWEGEVPQAWRSSLAEQERSASRDREPGAARRTQRRRTAGVATAAAVTGIAPGVLVARTDDPPP